MLEIKGLKIHFDTEDGVLQAVDGVDMGIDAGETLGVVGESGCGKSVTSLSIMRLVAQPGRIEAGEIMFEGQDLLRLGTDDMRKIRGEKIAMIFQQPTSSLNPVWQIDRQITEVLEIHRNMTRAAAHDRALELLRMVGIPDPERRLKSFPHEMSGGMAQRVMIAMALACEPDLLIADEPTTALDVTIQAQILELLRELQRETGMSVLFVTHDLGVVADFADEVVVMYAGCIVEQAPVATLFHRPMHPYTEGLMGSIPKLGRGAGKRHARLVQIEGAMPRLNAIPAGCAFHPRCGKCFARCRLERPEPISVGPSHSACWLHAGHPAQA